MCVTSRLSIQQNILTIEFFSEGRQRNAKPKPIARSATWAEYAYVYAWRCSALEEAEVEEVLPAAVVEVAVCEAALVVDVPFRRMALR